MSEKTENSAELIKQYKAGWVAGKRDAHLSYMRQIAEKDAEITEEQRVSNLRADAVERWTNTCAQQDEIITGLRYEIARLRQALDFIVRTSKIVNAKGASTGPQWITFGASIIIAEYALKGDEA